MAKINRAYRFRIIPNKQQKVLINKTLGCVRFIYNNMLGERQSLYEDNLTINTIEKMYGCDELTKFEREFKTEKQYKEKYDWLAEVDSIALQQARIDMTFAYKNFFRKIKNKEATKLKFKSRKNPKNSYRTINQKDNIRIEDNKIKLPKLGWIKFRKSKDVSGKIRNVTISKTLTGKYYISISVVESVEQLEPLNKTIGIDLGIKNFITTSDNKFFDNPKYLAVLEKKLINEQRKLSRKLQRKLDKKQKVEGSNIDKSRLKVSRLHEKIKNQRQDFLHKLSTRLINENQIICLESLNIKGMIKNHKLAKSISDCSWSEFVRMLEYKAGWYGRKIIKIDTFFPSSKLCSSCGQLRSDLTLAERAFKCDCGLEIDRDYNASINILNEGLKSLKNTNRGAREDSLVNNQALV